MIINYLILIVFFIIAFFIGILTANILIKKQKKKIEKLAKFNEMELRNQTMEDLEHDIIRLESKKEVKKNVRRRFEEGKRAVKRSNIKNSDRERDGERRDIQDNTSESKPAANTNMQWY